MLSARPILGNFFIGNVPKPLKKMVLLRGIGPPTPSLPMTCSTTELQQRIHFFAMQNSAPKNKNEAGKCHSYNPMASPDCKCLDNQIKNCGLAGISAQLR